MTSQPIRPVVGITANATGAGEAEFAAVPNMLTFTGSLHVAKAPATAQFCADIGPTEIGCWWGSQPFGPIQLQQNETLTIEARGLVPGRSYLVYFIGESTDTLDVPFEAPQASGIPLATTANLFANDKSSSAGPADVTLIAAPGADLSVVVYTCEIAAGATPGGVDASITATTIGKIFAFRGIQVQPLFGNFGGLILPANAAVSGHIQSNAGTAEIEWLISYSILPTS